MSKKVRNYVLTINNYERLPDITEGMKYLVYGKEVAPTTGTPHLQGFVVYNNAVPISRPIKDFPGAHVEVARGTPAQCIDYSKKDGDFIELGIAPMSQVEKGQAEVDRWGEALKAYQEDRREDIPPDILVRNLRGLKAAASYLKRPVLEDTSDKMLWYYGGSGTGKSRKAREENPGAYLKMCNKWWDDYDGQEVVIIEDFDVKHEVLIHHMKIWCDRYPFPAEVKGGKIDIRPRLIIVTSNYHPSDIWTDERSVEPILRRFNCIEFKKFP